MIDEKKIEEAAEKHFDNIVLNTELYQGDIVGAFKAGINWLLDNLWHDASEEPKKDKDLLVCHVYSRFNTYIAVDRANTLYDSWRTKVDRENITRYLYIDDLLKGGK